MKLSVYKESIEYFTNRLLSNYNQLVESLPAPSSKEFNDSLWRTIVLYPFEIIILDSPIIQRLRHVRQLGVVHWIYPSANHSRLEHSIGTLHQVQRMLESIDRDFSDLCPGTHRFPREYSNLLRITALCHDIGHGVMSHVSEKALTSIDSVRQLHLDLSDHFKKEYVPFSEAAAYFMIGSPAFVKLCHIAIAHTNHSLPSNYVSMMQDAVMGQPILDRFPLLHELISGPFDADKLDYMPRDALMTGVPNITDIPRLIQKIRLVEVGRDDLPKEIGKTVRGNYPSYYLQCIALSGATTLDELMIGRALLYDKVYRHQKVRALESMISGVLSAISGLVPDKIPMLPLLLTDDDIVNLQKDNLELKCDIKISEEQWESLEPARNLSGRIAAISGRDLLVRAYAFSQSMPNDPFKNEDFQRRGLEGLYTDVKNPEAVQEMLDSFVENLFFMRECLPELKNFVPDSVSSLIAIDPPGSLNQTTEISRAFLTTGDKQILHYREDYAESPGWSNAYSITRDLGFIFTTRELAPYVYLSAELVFRAQYGFRTPSSTLYYTKLKYETVDDVRRRLTVSRFYDSHPNDLRAKPERLLRADIELIIRDIVLRLSQFEGLASSDQDKESTIRITPERVHTFLRQFESDDDVDAMLSILSNVRVIHRSDVHASVRSFMGENPDFNGAYVCPLGSPKDSSAILTYYVQDLVQQYDFKLCSFSEALSNAEGRVLFVDDFIGSGNQAITIMNGSWFGRKIDAPLEEDHGLLPEGLREQLTKFEFGFLFICGHDSGLTALCNEAKKNDLKVKGKIHIRANDVPCAFSGNTVRFKNQAQQDEFKRKCEKIASELLREMGGKERQKSWIEQRTLGYGNKGYLLVFPYNVPTHTLTLLWCTGKTNGWDWLPLLPRRAKI